MTAFQFLPTPAATEIRLSSPALPVDAWSLQAPTEALAGVDVIHRLIASDQAVTEGDLVLVEHRAIAALSAGEAAALGLPPPPQAIAELRTRGILLRPDFQAELHWKRPGGQTVVGARRVGAWLRIGAAWHRLPDVLFALAEAVDALATVTPGDEGARLEAIAALRDALPAAQAEGAADAPGLIGTLSIAVADAFSLDCRGEGEALRLLPVLHRACGLAPEEIPIPLLPAELQADFGEDWFHRRSTVASVYPLRRDFYVVLAPVLRQALGVVRRVQSASPPTPPALLAEPRAFLRQALGEETEQAVLEGVFRETPAWSSRVMGMGLWQSRVLPWLRMPAQDWFDGAVVSTAPRKAQKPEAEGGLRIGVQVISLDAEAAEQMRKQVEVAIAEGESNISWPDGETSLTVPATPETLGALQRLENARAHSDDPGRNAPSSKGAETLLILPNEEAVEIEAEVHRRQELVPGIPGVVHTPLQTHQREGLKWLQDAWRSGRPGVLLADDMGLGKTLQALAFLAWLRKAIQTGRIKPGPLLVVAPTGLLENWRAEHDRHLTAPGLGPCIQAYGRHLAALRGQTAEGRPGLDITKLQAAGWVLTTYETLRDHLRDFGLVDFVALVFDEAQKIKTPAVRMTDAAKAIKAEFRIALTGTPVENRLADLWCIVDAVHPACLGDLKEFSRKFETTIDPDAIGKLKRQLDYPVGGRPPLMLRRLKRERLAELPKFREEISELTMPDVQQQAYREALDSMCHDQQGGVLAALHRLRRISLHPDPAAVGGDEAFIAASARLQAAVRVLDNIHERGERALVFLGDLDMQARLVGLLQRRYRMHAPPLVINGEVSGPARQARVDHFQSAPDGFDVMLLSPKAGGVGLTLTRANHVIHLDRWWNPAVEDQCNGRVLRIGQTREVCIHVPLAVLGTQMRSFDQNLNTLLGRKRRLMEEALCPPKISRDEYRNLFDDTVRANES